MWEHYTVTVEEPVSFRAQESQVKELENLVTMGPELPEQVTEGRMELWGGNLC